MGADTASAPPVDVAEQLAGVRWPVAPLEKLSGLTVYQLAEAIGWERTIGRRWEQRGLTDRLADHVAVAVGLHPAEVWPGWCEAVDDD
jgi:hypothetical protein